MEREGKTLLVMSELYPSQQALDTAQEGMDEAMPETFRSWRILGRARQNTGYSGASPST